MPKVKGDINVEGEYQINGSPLGADDLADVDTSTAAPSINDLLRWDGSNWVPVTFDLDDINDVSAGSPTTGQVLAWNGSVWAPTTGSIDGISVYDTTGGQTFTGVITVNLDTVHKNTDGGLFSLTADVVTVSFTGTVLIAYETVYGVSSGGRSESASWMEVDTGGGFGEIIGSRSSGYHRQTFQGRTTSSATFILDVTTGDDFRLRGDQISGSTLVTVADQSRLTILRMS